MPRQLDALLATIAERRSERPVVTIGNFDGVHLGHQAVFDRVLDSAARRRVTSVALTFHPHPVVFFGKRQAQDFCLTTPQARMDLVAQYGIHRPMLLPFDLELAGLTAEEFVDQVIHRALGAVEVWVGYDFNFGRGRSGNTEDLRQHGESRGIEVNVHEAVKLENDVVSSTRVRRTLAKGDLHLAQKLLGRHHAVQGVVTQGAQRGRTFGFPTLNIAPEAGTMMPSGTYMAMVCLKNQPDKALPAVSSIGTRPTIGPDLPVLLETFVLEGHPNRELYGEPIHVDLLDFHRPEARYPSLDELQAAIAADVDAARRFHRLD